MQPSALAITAALAHFLRAEVRALRIGIIAEAHDPTAAFAIAHATSLMRRMHWRTTSCAGTST